MSVVFIHGFTGSPASWDAVRRLLPDGTESHAVCLTGHGPATRSLDVASFEDEVDRIAHELRPLATGPRKPRLCGYSLGGRVALGLLVRHGALFERAVLVGVHPGLESPEARAERAAIDAAWCALLEERGIEAFVERWQALPLFATQRALPASSLAAQRAERLGHDPAGLARSLRVTGLAQMPDYLPALPDIAVPVTLIAGEHDDKFCTLATSMLARLPSARLVIAEGAGHNVVLEQPGLIAQELRA